jgi:uncharacterized NAD(P)/FAD-binding protein YdhS
VQGQCPTVVVIGAGASGVLAGLHILAVPGPRPARLVLFERTGKVAGGAAFSTGYQTHLLNVPAGSMSAFPNDPGHFARWLDRHGRVGAGDEFVPRQLYRLYLRDTLWSYAHSNSAATVVEVREDDVVDVEPGPSGGWVVPARGEPLWADAVVLASGIVPRRFPRGLVPEAARHHCVPNPWSENALAGIDPSATVTIVGTGLSAIDVLLALQENGHGGAVHALSRHGLLPLVHRSRPSRASGTADKCRKVGDRRAGALLHQVREIVAETEAQGGDWRDVVDLLRPRAQELWMGLSPDEQSRFKRHLERFWNIHRHRMPPQVGEQVERLREAGLFHVHPGRLVAVEERRSSLSIAVKTGRPGRVHHWATDWLVNCMGPDPDAFRDDQVLLCRLRARRLARPGPLGTGVDTGLNGDVLGASGHPVGWLWALGSLRQGQLLESTAVPEIRLQAQQLAAEIAQRCVPPFAGVLAGREPLAANY